MVNLELKNWREKKGFSHDDMSKKLKISKPYYWQIENGKRNLYYRLAIKIADILETRPDEIFYNYFKSN